MDPIYLFFALNYLAQGMSGIAYEPIAYLLKDRLGLSAGQSAGFIALMTLPFLIKPVFGLLTDLFPLGRYRRFPHIALASGMATAAWVILAAYRQYSYGFLLAMLFFVNVGISFSDVVCDGVMVEQGKALHLTGRYQAVQIGTLYFSLVFSGLGGGWLAAHASYRTIFILSAFFPLMILISTRWMREPPSYPSTRSRALREFSALFLKRKFWILSLIILLWNFYPFLGTVQFYYQSEILHLSPLFIGALSMFGGFAGFLGAAFFYRAHGKLWDPDALVRAGAVIAAAVSLLYFLYLGPISTALVETAFGFASVVLRLGLMDLLARSCPELAEATTFALFMSVFDLAAWGSNTLGGKLYDVLKTGFAGQIHPERSACWVLVGIGALCTLACWWLVPLVTQKTEELSTHQAETAA